MKGRILNIQRFSVNDGPGIRTTVFLKGCPLHCKWCHNPESIAAESELVLRSDRCVRCGDCFELCKNKAIQRVDGGFTTSRQTCMTCGDCVDVCSAEAREIAGKEMDQDEVLGEIEKDVIFYEQSGGGASFSGGEPLLQHEFLMAVLELCKKKGIHTVVDTTGFTSPEILRDISRCVDLFLYDLKMLDDKKHREYVGVTNSLVISNLRRLAEWKKKIIVRMPIIPGINDSIADVQQAGEFVASLRAIDEIHLLPYHMSGVEKYSRLGKEYELSELRPPSADDMSMIVKELRRYVPSVSIGG
ncbi:MAG TPA: glycyl-radical enzyme activating protein [Bacteroidota bacterium]|nr:glycyl-radical enzyme activating protein [Bacteroidota bacterium]